MSDDHDVIFLSGGLGSFLSADIHLKKHPRSVLLFTDTKMEDEDLYRFLDDIEKVWGKQIVKIADGRTPWEVFRDVRYLGNSRVDPCSRILKRELARKWIKKHTVDTDRVVFGIGPREAHRMKAIKKNWSPRLAIAPLIDYNIINIRHEAEQQLIKYGIETPRLYDLGFHHNNCGGFCVKTGHGQMKVLLTEMPKRYLWHEQQEEELRQIIGKNVAIMRDRTGKKTTPMTMREFRRRVQSGCFQVDMFDHGGCGCMT